MNHRIFCTLNKISNSKSECFILQTSSKLMIIEVLHSFCLLCTIVIFSVIGDILFYCFGFIKFQRNIPLINKFY